MKLSALIAGIALLGAVNVVSFADETAAPAAAPSNNAPTNELKKDEPAVRPQSKKRGKKGHRKHKKHHRGEATQAN